MPLKTQNVIVQAQVWVPGDPDAHPEHPIYIPVEPPPDSGLSPEHPIYIPVYPAHPIAPGGEHPEHPIAPGGERPEHPIAPGGGQPEHPIYIPVDPPGGGHPEHPIYVPVFPEHPIELPPPVDPGLSDEQKEALRGFLLGNLPPAPGHVEPVF
jgi:hypothetical protein